MTETICAPFPQTESEFFPNYLFTWEDIKLCIEGLIDQIPSLKNRRYNVHKPDAFIMVKLYSLSSELPTHLAAEVLNERLRQYHENEKFVSPMVYKDNRRRRRYVPHQTEIDKFFRRLSESEVEILFAGLLNYLVYRILQEQCEGRSWLSMVDNTKYPYYGKKDPLKHIGSNSLPGTKHAWMFQGVSMHSQDIHLYTQYYSLTKGIYRALNVPMAVDLQKVVGADIKRMVFDREFYRAKLVSELKKRDVKVLFPTKKYAWVKHRMSQYLRGTSHFIQGNIFAQSSKHYPYQSTAYVRLVIIGTDNQAAWEIREEFRSGLLNYSQAMKKLKGFYTTYKPWKNHKSWARYLVREYKRRWNIETAFSILNKVHESGRERVFTTKLASMHLRGTIYNWWQSWRLSRKRTGYHFRDQTLNEFKKIISIELEEYVKEIY